jgi:hypothetical protein
MAGIAGGHEEGGFVVRDAKNNLRTVRWQRGEQYAILVPAHAGCTIDGMEIVASFHTHPNMGPEALQEPSETDKRAVRDDVSLKGANYIGEFVLSAELIYLISPAGHVSEIGNRQAFIGQRD